jgi:serine/threonine-protein kinase HipA
MSEVVVLEVLLYGTPIGTLTRIAGDRTLFAFNDDYIADENRPTLGLSFKTALGELITEFRPHQRRLMPYFSNLLPEGHMRTYLAQRAGVNPEREFFLLQALGADLPGGITIRPTDGAGGTADLPDENIKDEPGRLSQRPQALRFSLAGVQLKFSALNEVRGGLTIPAQGIGGSWIVKLQSQHFDRIPENEYSMMALARLVGMDVPAIDLVPVESIANLPSEMLAKKGPALAVQRFDRLPDNGTVHVEDFAQVFGVYPADKYGQASSMNIGKVIAAEGDDKDIAEFIRRLTFNTLIGNADMHLKNWSVIYHDRRRASLAPAYDFVSTIPYIPDENAALKYSRTKRFSEFTEDELSHLAARARLPERLVLDTARETVERFHQNWAEQKAHLPLSSMVTEAIERHLATLPIARGAGAQ